MCSQIDKNSLRRFIALVFFGIAFAYIESAVVVYLRAIFYPDGFNFPITDFEEIAGFGPYLVTEIGREAATLVLMFTASYMLGRNLRRRFAYFLTIFAVWDIFYYVWLKVLIDWPATIMDWDILFLIPVTWAGPVLAPVITSATMLIIAAVLFTDKTVHLILPRLAGFSGIVLMIVVVFCIAGINCTKPEYKLYFSWPGFIALHIAVILLLFGCILRKKEGKSNR
ncbi:MAG TPA: hypothetical protein HPP87_08250 [Planctomycetes bacterium]|nr:hypothetical protein [Planctomycetota bacterium]HIJ71339.1 hypothetical protein [Planctomycetota bacterium]